jgi:hypothetical protein
VSHFALLAVSLGVQFVGSGLAAATTRTNVTAVERGVTAGRVVALIGVLAIGGGILGAVVAVVLMLRG